YNDGFLGRPFTTTVPPNLGRVVIAVVNANSAPAQPEPASAGPDPAPSRPRNANSDPDDKPSRRALVPDGLEMKIRLNTQISTKTNREGDKFTAVVLDPSDYSEAVIEGHVASINKSGRATGKTELPMAFHTIRFRDARRNHVSAQIQKV